MAGLALVFSMAEQKKPMTPPLILLDEVDAHLDEANVAHLTKFIKDWKSDNRGLNSQILIISHKESCLSECQSLIGVTQQEYLPAIAVSTEASNEHKLFSAVTFSMNLE
mmetsp:Transcript_36469/g.55987  ORF Transcript_36469/g.55987 Transcript_36469/m.55987 type:complete len:109 (+) Transcript_36469:2460-2786(+)